MKFSEHGQTRRVIVVTWKGNYQSTEVFSSLKNFCLSYSKYNYHTLTHHLSKGKKYFENDNIKIERTTVFTKPKNDIKKPNLYKGLFWDFDYETINWQKSYRTVIERVLERGTPVEWEELIRFYTRGKVTNALLKEIKYLPDHIISTACNYFGFQKEDLACYTRMQSRKEHWT